MAYTTIDDPTQYFNTVTYTGNGASSHAITGVGHQPDWVWIKRRDGTVNHLLHDSIRGVTKLLVSNSAGAEDTNTNILISFDSDGFTVGANSASNVSSGSFVSWNWKAGTTISSTSTSGSGTAKTYTGSVSTTAGFSIIRYVGNQTAGHTIPHHLGAKPDAILVKHLGDGQQWATQWSPLGATKVMRWASTNSVSDSNTRWNDTEPTTSVFTVGTEHETNTNDGNHIAYCFTSIKGYSKIGSYTGNANDNGTYSYTGFKPAWIMIKRTDASKNWYLIDNKRETFNPNHETSILFANSNNAEQTLSDREVDFLSNGFKLRGSDGDVNASGGTYIYMAFAESPFVNSKGIPTNAR